MSMIDYHSHILPKMDDGAASSAEAFKMLMESKNQDVSIVCATPHFYPDRDNPDSFLERRKASFERLMEISRGIEVPKICLGAEVAYYYGIGRSEEISAFCYEGTNMLLLEMPFCPWTQSMLTDVQNLAASGITPILAHFERYLGWNDVSLMLELKQCGVKIQSNASFFINEKTEGLALKLVKDGFIDCMGSDMHNLSSRPPNLKQGYQAIINGKG